jgi:hypothetical protein
LYWLKENNNEIVQGKKIKKNIILVEVVVLLDPFRRNTIAIATAIAQRATKRQTTAIVFLRFRHIELLFLRRQD